MFVQPIAYLNYMGIETGKKMNLKKTVEFVPLEYHSCFTIRKI